MLSNVMSNAAVSQAVLLVVTQVLGVHSCMAAMLLLASGGMERLGLLICMLVAISSLLWMLELQNNHKTSQASGAYMVAALVFALWAGLAKNEKVICAFAAMAISTWFAELDNDDTSSKLSGGYRAYQAAALLLALWAGMESTALLICLLASIGGIILVVEAENHDNSRMPSSKLCTAYQIAALLLALGAGLQCIGLLACLVVATGITLMIVDHSADMNSTLGTKAHGQAPAARLSSLEAKLKAAQDSLAREQAEKGQLAASLAEEQEAHKATRQQLRERAEIEREAARAWLERSANLRQLPYLAELADTDISSMKVDDSARTAMVAAINVWNLQRPTPGPRIYDAPCGKDDIKKAVRAVHPNMLMQRSPEVCAFLKEMFTSASSVVHAAADRIKSSQS